MIKMASTSILYHFFYLPLDYVKVVLAVRSKTVICKIKFFLQKVRNFGMCFAHTKINLIKDLLF